ncbi:hypothetical protein V6B08_10655 [Ferrovibrio sp. MS7]|uniref:hypothetical protein n=1 Tax=Ferrovibrio plantarum TaxID=3119164 RepID=UPI0031350343
MTRPKFDAIPLGPLPVDLINLALGVVLAPGNARLSAQAHRHMATDHPEDYPLCVASLGNAIKYPHYVGQGPQHEANFELIYRIPRIGPRAMLLAISMERDANGDYSVRTAYLISQAKLEHRRQQGRIKPINQKGPA